MNITDHDVFMETNRLAVLATTAIERAMERDGLKRSELAKRLGVPRSRVTKVLDGETNMTLKTFASFGLACGVRWQFLEVNATVSARQGKAEWEFRALDGGLRERSPLLGSEFNLITSPAAGLLSWAEPEISTLPQSQTDAG